jgi:hypothetical protein
VATKEDYIFTRIEGSNNFKAHKLSSLVLTVLDSNEKPLEGVSLSLTASKKFRVSGVTNANGQFKFVALNKGKFYLTSILKEYEFGQSSFTIDIEDGHHAEKTLKATRVAFSVYGNVQKMSGTPLEEARVVAKCVGCDKDEETVAEVDGSFRLRGLIPGKKYSLKVIAKDIERSVPNHIQITMDKEDSLNHQFLVIMRSSFIEISGSVDFEGEDQKAVFREDPKAIVELYDPENLDTPIQSWQLSLSRYFQFSSLPRKAYVVRVTPKRGANDRRYDSKTFRISQEGGF